MKSDHMSGDVRQREMEEELKELSVWKDKVTTNTKLLSDTLKYSLLSLELSVRFLASEIIGR